MEIGVTTRASKGGSSCFCQHRCGGRKKKGQNKRAGLSEKYWFPGSRRTKSMERCRAKQSGWGKDLKVKHGLKMDCCLAHRGEGNRNVSPEKNGEGVEPGKKKTLLEGTKTNSGLGKFSAY